MAPRASPQRRELFWPMVIGILLAPWTWLFGLFALFGIAGVVRELMDSPLQVVVFALPLAPLLGWALPARWPFAVVAVLAALSLIPWGVFAWYTGVAVFTEASLSAGAALDIAVLAGLSLLYLFWFWTMWRTAFPRRLAAA